MNCVLLSASLLVLSALSYGDPVSVPDVDLVKASALPEECDLDLEDLARRVVERTVGSRQLPAMSGADAGLVEGTPRSRGLT